VIASIELAVEGRAEIARAWSDPKGSRGEGIVLLPGGHLLVAKEKKEAALIELGPPDSRSRGLLRGDALADRERWRTKKGAAGSWLSPSGFPAKHSARPAPTSVTSKLVRMVVSISSVTSPPQLRGWMISRRVAAPQRSLMVVARRPGWQGGRSCIHRTRSRDRRARHTQAAPKFRPARAGGC